MLARWRVMRSGVVPGSGKGDGEMLGRTNHVGPPGTVITSRHIRSVCLLCFPNRGMESGSCLQA